MLGRTGREVVHDPEIPALAPALEGGLVMPHLLQAAGLPDEVAEGLACSVRVLGHKPGQRFTVLFTLSGAREPRSVSLLGKFYRRKRVAARVFRWTEHVRDRLRDGPPAARVPAPLLLVPDLGLVLQEYVEGEDLRHSLLARDSTPILLSARAIAALHVAPPAPDLRVATVRHEMQKADRWCDEIEQHLSVADARRIRRTQTALHDAAGENLHDRMAMIHRDFYYANVLWDGQRPWVVDLDQLSLGDPALDVGHFLAHLENLSLRATGRTGAFTESAAAFLAAYEAATAGVRPRLPMYRAYTFLKLAATEATRKRDDWQRLMKALVCLAYSALLEEN